MRQIFLDTETTGLSPQAGDRIVEIGCVEMINRKLSGNNRHYYLFSGRESHEEAFKIHGITMEFLRDKPGFEKVVDDLLEYLSGSEVLIHNAAFDLGFLNKELDLIGRPGLESLVAGVTDTMMLAREMFPGKRSSLDALCERLGVDRSARTLHGALLDAELLAQVYLAMTRGQEALLIDEAVPRHRTSGHSTPELSGLDLPVLLASELELNAHEAVLQQLDASSAGKTVWRLAAVK